MVVRPRLLLCASWLAAACSNSPPPFVATVAANPNDALSALVSFAAPAGARAHVVSTANGARAVTPDVIVAAGGQTIAVLGLAPSTSYSHVVELELGGAIASSLPVSAVTGVLPPDLATVKMTITPGTGAPASGAFYLVSGAGVSSYAFDASGAIRWYRGFGQSTEETKLQPDGTFTTYVGASTGWQPVDGQFVRYAPDGTQLATYAVASPDDTEPGSPPLYTDPHELLITTAADGSERLHLFGYAVRPVSATDPTPAAWHELVRQDESGAVELRWKSWMRFSDADSTEAVVPPAHDIDHANALAIDPTDGNYVASFRDTDTLLKLDYGTGDVVWQLGGKQNQFTFVGDPLGGFQGQHSVRVLADGDLLIFDNGLGHTPPESRAVEYRLDTETMTASMVWQFRHAPAIETTVTGSVERLASGNTLVAFANAGVVDEVDAQGSVVWEGRLVNGTTAINAYRIRALPSLYQYRAP